MSIATFHVASTARLASANHVASPPARIWEWLRLQRSGVAPACVLSHDEEELILQHHMAPSPNDVAVVYFPPAVGGGDGDIRWTEVDRCIDALIFKKVDVIGVWEHAWHYNSMRGGKRIDFMPENNERKCRHVYKIGRRRNMVDFGKQIAVEVARRANAFLLDTTTPIFEGFTVLQSRKFRVATQNRSTPLTVFQESACSAFTFENGRRVISANVQQRMNRS